MRKDIIKQIAIGIGSPILVAAILSFSSDFSNTASSSDLEKAKKEAIKYTDDVMKSHEKNHVSIKEKVDAVNASNIRLEEKVDKILFLLAK